MEIVMHALLALLFLVPAFYAQWFIPKFTQGKGKIVALRLLLFLVAFAYGWLISSQEPDTLTRILHFIIGAGAVHIPAAVILLIKSRRGAGKT